MALLAADTVACNLVIKQIPDNRGTTRMIRQARARRCRQALSQLHPSASQSSTRVRTQRRDRAELFSKALSIRDIAAALKKRIKRARGQNVSYLINSAKAGNLNLANELVKMVTSLRRGIHRRLRRSG